MEVFEIGASPWSSIVVRHSEASILNINDLREAISVLSQLSSIMSVLMSTAFTRRVIHSQFFI